MMDLDFIEGLLKAFDESGADSLEIERGGSRIRLAKTPPAVAAPLAVAAATPAPVAVEAPPGPTAAVESAPSPGHLLEITSPMVGTFYIAPAPDGPDYVEAGSTVSPGDTLCIIEAMKLMNELECEVTGTITEICVENAQPVEFGQVLFRVDPS